MSVVKQDMMPASKAIETGMELIGRFDERIEVLEREVVKIKGEWAALVSLGADREDHAARLVARLRPHVEAIQCFAKRCVEQIDAVL